MACTNSQPFKFGHLNVRSLLPKMADLVQIIQTMKFDLLSISETWLQPNINSNAVAIEGFSFVRQDRNIRGGGVGMYIRNTIKYKILQCDHSIEQLWISIQLPGDSIIFGVVYKTPAMDVKYFTDLLEHSLEDCTLKCDIVFCAGDFNIDCLKPEVHATTYFLSMLESLGFDQIINTPTRLLANATTLIDLIITTNKARVNDSGVVNCNISDHDLVYSVIDIQKPKKETLFRTIRDYDSIDRHTFLEDLHAIALHRIFYMTNINDKVAFLNDCILNLFNTHAPEKEVRFTKPYHPWITDNVRLLMSLRDKAKAKFRATGCASHWNHYKTLRNFTTLTLKNEKKMYFLMLANSPNKRQIWKQLKLLDVGTHKSNNLPPDLADSNLINNHFINSIPAADGTNCQISIDYYLSRTVKDLGPIFNFQPVDVDVVGKYISEIKTMSVGSDGISIKMLNLCCPYITPFITHIINSCITGSGFPNIWKHALITPIPKIKEPINLNDLRPVSILPILSKVFEKIINKQLREHLILYNILPESQSGFRKGHSCTTALLGVTDDILETLDHGEMSALVLLDYSKAFDTINHEVLAAILHFMGLTDDGVSLISSYLGNRFQSVKVDSNISVPLPLVSGVPQGSILGPLLFIIYTSNFHTQIKHCRLHMYADDTQIYHAFTANNCHVANQSINEDLIAIQRISKQHALSLNPAKSVINFW